MEKVSIKAVETHYIEVITKTGHAVVLTDNVLWRLQVYQHGFEDRRSEKNEGIKYFRNEAAELYDALVYCQDHGVYEEKKIFQLMDIVRTIREEYGYFKIPDKIPAIWGKPE
jgi:hypothetical protein